MRIQGSIAWLGRRVQASWKKAALQSSEREAHRKEVELNHGYRPAQARTIGGFAIFMTASVLALALVASAAIVGAALINPNEWVDAAQHLRDFHAARTP
jgi:tryptophan synthase alpha subunit